ncbi:uncharacterized protein EV420DRAFT_1488947 [Desarmillaria tabescens]|uniref:Uncharacterized protein n=1 Tax=Armillaria tabescens TaxID=1929756 RepID=A0AA39J087_ARMTA|nr:uncharacterized protein EV420DRAFT_1488947 [Desarmillaria tabescens]KAK0433750.1 hypothetical protein EV420DRAFT_1488947 [Desarmillaria tabescens]
MKLDFAHGLSGVMVMRGCCVNETTTDLALPSLTSPRKASTAVIIQRSGKQEWVTVADIIGRLRQSLRCCSSKNQDDAAFDNHRRMQDCEKWKVVQRPRLGYLIGKMWFTGFRANRMHIVGNYSSNSAYVGLGGRYSIVAVDSTRRATDEDNGLPLEELTSTWFFMDVEFMASLIDNPRQRQKAPTRPPMQTPLPLPNAPRVATAPNALSVHVVAFPECEHESSPATSLRELMRQLLARSSDGGGKINSSCREADPHSDSEIFFRYRRQHNFRLKPSPSFSPQKLRLKYYTSSGIRLLYVL